MGKPWLVHQIGGVSGSTAGCGGARPIWRAQKAILLKRIMRADAESLRHRAGAARGAQACFLVYQAGYPARLSFRAGGVNRLDAVARGAGDLIDRFYDPLIERGRPRGVCAASSMRTSWPPHEEHRGGAACCRWWGGRSGPGRGCATGCRWSRRTMPAVLERAAGADADADRCRMTRFRYANHAAEQFLGDVVCRNCRRCRSRDLVCDRQPVVFAVAGSGAAQRNHGFSDYDPVDQRATAAQRDGITAQGDAAGG